MCTVAAQRYDTKLLVPKLTTVGNYEAQKSPNKNKQNKPTTNPWIS